MNIWIRILIALSKSLFQKRIGPTDVVRTTMIVGPTEADLKYVSNARYLLFMEVGRLEMMLRTRILKHARKCHWVPLVASQTIRYRSPLKRFQRFTLTSRLVAWDEKWFFIEHKIERRGRLNAFAVAKCCFRSPDGVVPPSVAFSALGATAEARPLPQYASKWMESEEMLQEVMEGL